MTHCKFSDRAIIAVSGDDAEGFLNRLFTNSVLGMHGGEARYAALLSPQGKLLFDFIVCAEPGGFWLDVARDQAADLARKLTMFKLRAKVSIAVRDDLCVAATWGDAPMEAPRPVFRDPRHNELGYRVVGSADALAGFGDGVAGDYEAHRIALGVPKGGVDFVYGDTFVHDANLDLLHGVDFEKGCYVGQEVVSRVHHRGSARKRVVRLSFYGEPPAVGAAVTAGPLQIGQLTSLSGKLGLAGARIDRLAEAETASMPVTVGETLVAVTLPSRSTVTPNYAEDVV